MTFHHVWIRTNKGKDYFEHDHTEESVERLVRLYRQGKVFFFRGTNIDPREVRTFRICHTEHRKAWYVSNVWDSGKDVTRRFMQKSIKPKPDTKNIFIVHGKDHKPMKELKAMLQGVGLNPTVLHEKPSGSRTIVEKLEKYSDVGYAFVILTPDDIGTHRSRWPKPSPNDEGVQDSKIVVVRARVPLKGLGQSIHIKLRLRSRQNVILEFGYFMGLLGRDRVCCLYKGDIELPSDMHGIVYIPFKESIEEVRDKIIKELKAAGYEIKM